jgi:succinate dehydrogenase / fumarate reductase flavoprotein subunit
MEFIQFHPTGLYPSGILMSEAARSLGGRFLTADKEPLLEIYNRENQSSFNEMATRDKLAFILAGQISRQNDDRNYVYLDLSHLEESAVRTSLPELCELAKVYANKDLAKEPVPVSPTAHYSMGGIPADTKGRVLDWDNCPVTGLYAAGECACVSVHGANRLGGNSLLEALVFGEIAGRTIAASGSVLPQKNLLQRLQGLQPTDAILKQRRNNQSDRDWMQIRKTLRKNMTQYCGVLRSEEGLSVCLSQVERLKEEYDLSSAPQPLQGFSLARQEYFELGCMLDVSLAVVRSALSREESRGAHQRLDFPDSTPLPLHSLYRAGNGSCIKTIPVRGLHE